MSCPGRLSAANGPDGKEGGMEMGSGNAAVSVCWLILLIALVVIELGTMALTTIWFAGGALVAFILSLFGAGIEIQLTVFVIVSFLLLFFTRPWASQHLNKRTTRTNVESLIGRTARVTEEIDNDLGTGAAVVGGQEWTARAEEGGDICPVGTIVVICGVRGVKLIVRRKRETE